MELTESIAETIDQEVEDLGGKTTGGNEQHAHRGNEHARRGLSRATQHIAEGLAGERRR
jgi:hypothetical protein